MTVGVGIYDCQVRVRKSESPTGVREEMVGKSHNFSFNLQPTHIVTLTREQIRRQITALHISSPRRSSHCARDADTCNSSDAVVKDAEDGSLTDV